MLSLNMFPPATFQIGILIRQILNFEHCGQRLQRRSQSQGNVMLFLSELPPSEGQLELILHKSHKSQVILHESKLSDKSRCGLTEQMFQIPLVGSVWTVEKAPFSAYEVEGVHQVGAAQVLGGGRGRPWRVQHQQ